MASPYFLLAIAIIATLGPGLVNGLVAVAVVNIPFYGRIVRATVLAVKQTEYVESARALGASSRADACAAQLPGAGDRRGDAQYRRHDHGAGRPVLSRSRRAAAHLRLG